jgi:hypothetical protein
MNMKNLQKKILSQLIILIISITVFCIKMRKKNINQLIF